MYDVIVSTVRSGRVRPRRFDGRSAAEFWVRRMESAALRFWTGVRSIRVELIRVAA